MVTLKLGFLCSLITFSASLPLNYVLTSHHMEWLLIDMLTVINLAGAELLRIEACLVCVNCTHVNIVATLF